MFQSDQSPRRTKLLRWAACVWVAMILLALDAVPNPAVVRGQEPPTGPAADTQDLDHTTSRIPAAGDQPDSAPTVRETRREGIRPFQLIGQGGVLMIPIGLMSVLVVTIVIERFISLRKSRVLPVELVHKLGQLGGSGANFDPRQAYRICQQFPSAAATVIRAMLLKVGRPHSEVEHTVAEASQREAERLYSKVRWLNLAAAVTPLIGLFGTVWGMIEAFHDTTLLDPGQNKAEELARGIYTALVTTLGGLAVAIPAAIFAHYFEGRIQSLFHQIDELLFNLLPQIERYEGRVRFSRQPAEDGGGRQVPVAPPPVAEPTAAPTPVD